jgi:hypothetical protein
MKSAIVHLVVGLGQLLNAYYYRDQTPLDRETIELLSAITRWLEKHKADRH